MVSRVWGGEYIGKLGFGELWQVQAWCVRARQARLGSFWSCAVRFGKAGVAWWGSVRCGEFRSGMVRQARRGWVRCGLVCRGWVRHGVAGWDGKVSCVMVRQDWLRFGKAGMEGHRVVRLDVVCYVIVGLGVSGFDWFGSAGLERLVKARCGMFWNGKSRQERCGLSSYGVSGSGQGGFVLVRQARLVRAW